jgi:hypothetical protein
LLGVLLSVGRFIQTSTEIAAGRVTYNTPFADWLFLLGALFSAIKEAVVPFVAAVVLERFDRWLGQRQTPGTQIFDWEYCCQRRNV